MARARIDRGSFTDRVRRAFARQLRRDATPAERHAWSLLCDRRLHGLKFRRQHVIGPFVVDFYCPALRLVLELDGSPHDRSARVSYDVERTKWLEARGLRVIRLRNRDLSVSALERVVVPPLHVSGEGDRG